MTKHNIHIIDMALKFAELSVYLASLLLACNVAAQINEDFSLNKTNYDVYFGDFNSDGNDEDVYFHGRDLFVSTMGGMTTTPLVKRGPHGFVNYAGTQNLQALDLENSQLANFTKGVEGEDFSYANYNSDGILDIRVVVPCTVKKLFILGCSAGTPSCDHFSDFTLTVDDSGMVPVAGTVNSAYISVQEIMKEHIRNSCATSAALELRRYTSTNLSNHQTVLKQSYGWLDKLQTIETPQNVLMRTASVAKPITAIGIRKLINDGHVSLSTKVFCQPEQAPIPSSPEGCVLQPWPSESATFTDSDFFQITVNDLITHYSGLSVNSIPSPHDLVNFHGANSPPSIHDYVNYYRTAAVAENGSYKYSNEGYDLLAHVISVVASKPYIEHIHTITTPLGIPTSNIQLAQADPNFRVPNREPQYLTNGQFQRNLFPPFNLVRYPDGGGLYGHRPGAGGLIVSTDALITLMRHYSFRGATLASQSGIPRTSGIDGGHNGGGEGTFANAEHGIDSAKLIDLATLANWADGSYLPSVIAEVNDINN